MAVANSRPPNPFGMPAGIPMSEARAAYQFLQLHRHYSVLEWLSLVNEMDNVVREYAKTLEPKKPAKQPVTPGKPTSQTPPVS